MAPSVKCFTTVTFICIGFLLLLRYILLHLPGPYRAVGLRCMSITISNVVMLICSIYAWKRISCFISILRNDTEHRNSSRNGYSIRNGYERHTAIFKYLFFGFVVWASSSWYMPYIPMFRSSYDAHWFSFLTYLALGFLLQFLVCLYFINALTWIRTLYTKWQITTHRRRELRNHHVNTTDVPVSIIYALLCCMYGLHMTSLPQEIVTVQIPVVGLPKSFDGYSLVLLSDIHLGPTVGRRKLEQVVSIVNTMKADALVLVGDLADGPVERLGKTAEILKDIKVKDVKYFVTGNHEYYSPDVDQWFVFLRTLGFTVLHNEHVKITDSSTDEFFYLAGTDDIQATALGYTGHGYDLDKAVKSCDKDHPIVLLAHQPNAAQKALNSQYNIKLVLSGHTHGGQMFPLTILTSPFNAFQKGLYQYKGGYVYVSQGTMYWGIPLRIGTFMEITEIKLHAK